MDLQWDDSRSSELTELIIKHGHGRLLVEDIENHRGTLLRHYGTVEKAIAAFPWEEVFHRKFP